MSKGKFQPLGVGMRPCETRLGNLLRTYRLKRKLRQREVAKRARMGQNHYSYLEVGHLHRYIKPEQAGCLAEALHGNLNKLLKVGLRPKIKLSEDAILDLPRRSKNYLRDEDLGIGETRLKRVPRKRSPGGLNQCYVAYERPSTGERFRVIETLPVLKYKPP